MLFANIGVVDGDFELHEDWFVAVDGARIAYVGSEEPADDFGERYDGRGKVLMPGLVNAHTHVPMTLLRGYAENLPLDRWLQEMVWPFEDLITDEAALPASRLAFAEALRFGTVSLTDMYRYDEARIQAIGESGIKCNMAHGIIAFDPDTPYDALPECGIADKLIDEYHGAFDGRLRIDVAPHAPGTVVAPVLRAMGEHAVRRGVGLHIHVAETRAEQEQILEMTGMTPVAYLESLGVLDAPVTAAHCVWATDDDLAILAAHDATAATCPSSNLKLGSGIPSTRRFIASGVNVAIGTDSVSSNNALNLFRDLYLAAIAHKGAELDPVGVGAVDVLRAATAGGAHAQRRDDCGTIEEGKRADLVVLDVDVPWMQPVSSMADNIAYAANGSEVVLTMVDGKVLYKDGEHLTIDVEKAMYETQQARDAIVAQL